LSPQAVHPGSQQVQPEVQSSSRKPPSLQNLHHDEGGRIMKEEKNKKKKKLPLGAHKSLKNITVVMNRVSA
jgi:hypothetical protein